MAEGRFIPRAIAHDERLASVSLEAECLYLRILPHLDCEGRLGASPAGLWAMVAPLRAEITPSVAGRALDELAAAGLLTVYRVDGVQYLADPSFEATQRGLRKDREAPSRIPPPSTPDASGAAPALLRSTPELLPYKGSKEKAKSSQAKKAPSAPRVPEIDPDFEAFWHAYPRRANGEAKAAARAKWAARRGEGIPAAEMIAGAQRYAVCKAAEGTAGSNLVMQAGRFLGPGKEWQEPWTPDARSPDSNPHRVLAVQKWGQIQEWGVLKHLSFGGPGAFAEIVAELVAAGHFPDEQHVRMEAQAMGWSSLRGIRSDREAIAHLEIRIAMAGAPQAASA